VIAQVFARLKIKQAIQYFTIVIAVALTGLILAVMAYRISELTMIPLLKEVMICLKAGGDVALSAEADAGAAALSRPSNH
jgi:hypothetical protein